MRLIARSSVDLPLPDGPISEVMALAGTSKEMSFTARKAP
jgi:hypothetical protein